MTDIMHREMVRDLCRKITKEQAKLDTTVLPTCKHVHNNVPFVQSASILGMEPTKCIEWVLFSC